MTIVLALMNVLVGMAVGIVFTTVFIFRYVRWWNPEVDQLPQHIASHLTRPKIHRVS